MKSAAAPYKLGDLFTVPVNGEEDAELIRLIGRILDAAAAAADPILEIHTGCLSEYRCTTATASVHCSLFHT